MDRVQKKEVVAELDQIFSESGAVVVAHYAGLTVAEMSTLRAQMREAGARAKVAKNKLAKIALEGKPCEGISQYLTGQTMLAFSEDPIAAAKVAVEFAKKNEKLVILGGSMGDTILDENGVKSLASMPSLDELRGKIVGLLQAPATKLAVVTQAPAAQLARVFNAYATKDEAA